MSQTAAQQLAQVLKNLLASRASEQAQLATNTRLLASSKAELAAETLKVEQATQSLLAYKAKLTDPAQRAAVDQSIASLDRSKIISLNGKISAFEEMIAQNTTQLSELQKSISSTQTQISKEKSSEGQTGPVPTDTANSSGNTAVNVTNTAAPAAVVVVTGAATSTTDPVPTTAPQAIDQNTEPSNSSPFNQSATGNGVTVSPILGAPEPAGFSTQGLLQQARSQAVVAAQVNQATHSDWRVRLHLAQNANYLYNVANSGDVLFPLKDTEGVIFPYTPSINVQYAATYSPAEVVHSNYKVFQYKGSSVDTVTIGCEFTAQDNSEANYLLAVIHFFRSVTKMFYGLDQNPNPGVPPPLCYLSGLGQFQFNNHALVVTGFTYDLPTDVDYIRAGSPTTIAGTPLNSFRPNYGIADSVKTRTSTNRVPIGGRPFTPMFQKSTYLSNSSVTYVPTKMKMSIVCSPVVSRNQVSNKFSLKDYATGKLLKGGFW